MFNSKRLSIARHRRGLTKKRLAEMVALHTRAITAYEADEYAPTDETLAKLSEALDFPIGFFSAGDLDEPNSEGTSFRAMSKMSARQRDSALGAGAIAFLLNDYVEEHFDLPSADTPNLRDEEPSQAADYLRQYWGIGERPIRNVVHLMEAKGVRVFSLAENCKEVDAFSMWRDGQPYVFLNTFKSSEHSRFDAAHELGHLTLHGHATPTGHDAEFQANQFASAFLMPEGSVRATVPANPSVDHLIRLKKHWTVSVAALAVRLYRLGMISEWHYRSLCIEIQNRGYRTVEPEGASRETSQVWEKVFTNLRQEGVTKEILAERLYVPPREIEMLVFGLVLIGLTNQSASTRLTARRKDHLRLVE